MKNFARALLSVLLIVPMLAYADPWKDESGNGHHHDRHGDRYDKAYKTEYRDGRCKVERKWEGNGDYKEERKCRGYDDRPSYYDSDPAIVISTPDIVIRP
ncbi:hypothetical protein FNI46_09875 [Salmonella enterica subsp. salamae]|nr:hypothetical protein [Salmonella enterica subsp. salamae serovar Sofia]ECJ2536432.1 hypothetical protein [Salmonella enterica subsp. salamae serovar Sofia]EED7473243.1 hypothetical protein [Salmonella enterica subsp. salamae]